MESLKVLIQFCKVCNFEYERYFRAETVKQYINDTGMILSKVGSEKKKIIVYNAYANTKLKILFEFFKVNESNFSEFIPTLHFNQIQLTHSRTFHWVLACIKIAEKSH